jgi:hypothetical protein
MACATVEQLSYTNQLQAACSSSSNGYPDLYESVECQTVLKFIEDVNSKIERGDTASLNYPPIAYSEFLTKKISEAAIAGAVLTGKYCLNSDSVKFLTKQPASSTTLLTMLDYPIFTSGTCQANIRDQILSPNLSVQQTAHNFLNAFCQQSSNPVIPFGYYLQPKIFTQINTGETISINSENDAPQWTPIGVCTSWRADSPTGQPCDTPANCANPAVVQNALENFYAPGNQNYKRALLIQYPTSVQSTAVIFIRADSDVRTSTAPSQTYIDLIKTIFSNGIISTANAFLAIRGSQNIGQAKFGPSRNEGGPKNVTINVTPELVGQIAAIDPIGSNGDIATSENAISFKITLSNVIANADYIFANPLGFGLTCGDWPTLQACHAPAPIKTVGNSTCCKFSWNSLPDPETAGYATYGIGKFSIYTYVSADSPQNLPIYDKNIRGVQVVDHPPVSDFLMSMCSCHLSDTIYTNYEKSIIERIPSATKAAPNKDIKQCLFPGCAASGYPALPMLEQPPTERNTCETPLCVQTINLNNDGTIIAGSDISLNQSCNSVVQNTSEYTAIQTQINNVVVFTAVSIGALIILVLVIVFIIVLVNFISSV